MQVILKGFMESVTTFQAAGSITAGSPVKISANNTVAKAESGDTFIGVALNSREGAAGVQVAGYAELPYTGTAPEVGQRTLAADGAGGVKNMAAGPGRNCTVVNVNTTAKTVGFIM